ncbi:MAG TPA: ribonuclease III domain-containing protein [Clostridia bacterium]|nr:ribonuclease III domain-containing protein [Clostridia bacterium]
MSVCGDIRALLGEDAGLDAKTLASLTLAYVGDTVYELYVRTLLLEKGDAPVNSLHFKASRLVCASAQAEACERVMAMFSDEEAAVFRRGRNAHIGTIPKSASIAEYRAATGFEAVLGYLYLSGNDERIKSLMALALRPSLQGANNN